MNEFQRFTQRVDSNITNKTLIESIANTDVSDLFKDVANLILVPLADVEETYPQGRIVRDDDNNLFYSLAGNVSGNVDDDLNWRQFGSSVKFFTDLNDVFSSYGGKSLQTLRVKEDESGIESYDASLDFAPIVHTHVAADITNFNSSVTSIINAQKGIANGITPLGADSKISTAYLPDSILGNVKFKGSYNGTVIVSADPELNGQPLPDPDSSNQGWYFIVSSDFDEYLTGDWILSNGDAGYTKIDNTDAVVSVFGRIGPISAQAGDYNTDLVTEATNLYFTQTRARNSVSSTVAGITYTPSTGVFSLTSGYVIPQTTTNLPEGSNLYYTQARFDTAFGAKSTSNLSEGSNLYYTQARVYAKTVDMLVPGTHIGIEYDAELQKIQISSTAIESITTDDITEGDVNLFYTDDRSRAAWSESITGLSYAPSTGILTLEEGYLIPTANTFINNQYASNVASSFKIAGRGFIRGISELPIFTLESSDTTELFLADNDTKRVSIYDLHLTNTPEYSSGGFDILARNITSEKVEYLDSTYFDSRYYTETEINNFFSGATGISGYNKNNWDNAYTYRVETLTTTGSSGAATLLSNVLNIPTYTLAGLGGVASTRQLTLTGTSNQITINAGASQTYDLSSDRTWTMALPQDIATSSQVEFARLKLNDAQFLEDEFNLLGLSMGNFVGVLDNAYVISTLDLLTTTVAADTYSPIGHTHVTDDITDLSSYTGFDSRYYTETEINDFFSGSTSITGYNNSDWDTAFSWGDHADAGYALDADVVHKAGTESITGAKTFTLDTIISGLRIGVGNTTGLSTTAFGYNALNSNIDGQQHVAIGFSAMGGSTGGYGNIGIGLSSLNSNTTGSSNIGVGLLTLSSNTTGTDNIAINYQALISNTTGVRNTGIGAFSLSSNTTGTDNIAISGYQGLNSNTTGSYNIALGYAALTLNTIGVGNIGFGLNALSNNISGSNNLGLGGYALRLNTTGENNIGVGYFSGVSNTTGSNFISIGTTAGATGGTDQSYSILIGYEAGRNNAATYSILIGYQAGQNNTGTSNLFVGNSAGATNITGTYNAIFGNYSLPSTSQSNTLALADGQGNLKVYSPSSHNIILGGTTDNTLAKLQVYGALYLDTISLASSDTNKFLVSDSGVVKYSTGDEVLSYIGALSTTTAAATYVALGGSYSDPSWITSLDWSKITDTPTTLTGYGITDAISSSSISGTSGTLPIFGASNSLGDSSIIKSANTYIFGNSTTGNNIRLGTSTYGTNGIFEIYGEGGSGLKVQLGMISASEAYLLTAAGVKWSIYSGGAVALELAANQSATFSNTLQSGHITSTAGLTIAASNNLSWGGLYGAGIATLTADSTNGFQFYPTGSTGGMLAQITATGSGLFNDSLRATNTLSWGTSGNKYMYTVGGTQKFAYTISGHNILYSGGVTGFSIYDSADTMYLFKILDSGVATFISTVQGTQFISTVSTGTSPFTVSSTTEVDNLNAERWAGNLYGGSYSSGGIFGVMINNNTSGLWERATLAELKTALSLTDAITGTGTTGSLLKFTSSSTAGDSIASESGGVLTVGGLLRTTSGTIFAKGSGTESAAYQLDAITMGYDAVNALGWITVGGAAARTELYLNKGGGLVYTGSNLSVGGELKFHEVYSYSTGETFIGRDSSNGLVYVSGASTYSHAFANSTGNTILELNNNKSTRTYGALFVNNPTDTGEFFIVGGSARVNGTLATLSGNDGGLFRFYNNLASGSSRSWRLINDVAANGDFAIQQSTTQTGDTFANILYYANTGAATFSSSITATLGKFGGAGSNAVLEVQTNSGEIFRADANGGAYRIVSNQTGNLLGGTLDVQGAATLNSTLSSGLHTIVSGAGSPLVIRKSSSFTGSFYMLFQNSSSTEIGYLGYGSGSNDKMQLYNALDEVALAAGTSNFTIGFDGAASSINTTFTANSFIKSGSSDSFFLLGGGGTASVADYLTVEREINTGTGLTGGGDLSTNRTISLSHLGLESLTDPGADRIAFWDDSASTFAWLTLGTNLTITSTTINAAGVTGNFINNHQGTYVEQDGGYWTNDYNIIAVDTGAYIINAPTSKLIVNPFHNSGTLQDFGSNPYPVDVQIGAFEANSTIFAGTEAASLFIGMRSEYSSINKHGLFISEPEGGDGHYSILVRDYLNTDTLFSLIGGVGRFSGDIFANEFWAEGGKIRMAPSSGTGGEVLIQSDLGNLGTNALMFTLTSGPLEMTSSEAYAYLNNRTSDPDAPATGAVIFSKVVSGKTRLYVRFPTGAIQQVAIEP